ncbi:30S ribosomal protein S27e [Candidatus Pacearchaeota archaeon]|nr:30S ribosomal protein S27e [Candidatus Pacearchaeota archaeon]
MVKTKFLKIVCPRCGKKQIVYGKSSSRIKCTNCNKLLLQPTGGKTKIRAQIKEVL